MAERNPGEGRGGEIANPAGFNKDKGERGIKGKEGIEGGVVRTSGFPEVNPVVPYHEADPQHRHDVEAGVPQHKFQLDAERFDHGHGTGDDRRHEDTSADQFREHYYTFVGARYEGREDVGRAVSECQYRHTGDVVRQPQNARYHGQRRAEAGREEEEEERKKRKGVI